MELRKNSTEASIAIIEDECALCLRDIPVAQNQHINAIESDMDPWDFAICMATALTSVFITTSEDLEKWMAGVHDAASESSGNYDGLQTLLGKPLHRKDDNIDMFSTRDGDGPWRLFRRLFFRHDILGKREEFTNDSPFVLLARQAKAEGNPTILGVLHAVPLRRNNTVKWK